MKVLRANNPKPGTKPIVVALTDLSNMKLRDNFDYDTMDGSMQRYKTYLKDSFDKEGMAGANLISKYQKVAIDVTGPKPTAILISKPTSYEKKSNTNKEYA